MNDDLHCAYCGRRIGGITGLDELHAMIAHMEEHHETSLDIEEALDMRVEWEKVGLRHG